MLEGILNGDEAMAHGALAAGVSVVTSYPGSPSSGTVEVLIGLADRQGLHVEWSSNEKVALELGIGASIAGRRALVATKSVGMNAMLDPLMVLNLTPVHGGLVILLGDDPGGYGSQNDQDTRPLAAMLEMPLVEPSRPGRGLRPDPGSLRGVGAAPPAGDHPRDAELHPAGRAGRAPRRSLPPSGPRAGAGALAIRARPAQRRGEASRPPRAARGGRSLGRGACPSTGSWGTASSGHPRRRVRLPEAARRPGRRPARGPAPAPAHAPSSRSRSRSWPGPSRAVAGSWSSRRTSRSWRTGSRGSPSTIRSDSRSWASAAATSRARESCSAGRSCGRSPGSGPGSSPPAPTARRTRHRSGRGARTTARAAATARCSMRSGRRRTSWERNWSWSATRAAWRWWPTGSTPSTRWARRSASPTA